jgi:hypothetical protein
MKRRNLLTALVVTALAVAVPSALAGGGPGGALSTASVNVSPNPVPAGGARVDLTGCGYDMKPAELRIVHSAGYTEAYMDGVWADGCLNPTYFLTREAGTYTVSVYQADRNKRRPWVLKASATLTVG